MVTIFCKNTLPLFLSSFLAHRIRLPPETAGKLGLGHMGVQEVQEGVAFVVGQAQNAGGEEGVHEDGLAAGLRMGTNQLNGAREERKTKQK
jgi:hypothetical protein